MLTPQQVKNHRFQLGSRGTYRAEEVDAFVQELTASFEEAYTQNEALLKKISLLADKVEEYRRDEDTIRLGPACCTAHSGSSCARGKGEGRCLPRRGGEPGEGLGRRSQRPFRPGDAGGVRTGRRRSRARWTPASAPY